MLTRIERKFCHAETAFVRVREIYCAYKPEVRGDDIIWICGQHKTHWKERLYDSAGVQPESHGIGKQAGLQVCKLPEENEDPIPNLLGAGSSNAEKKKNPNKKPHQSEFPTLSSTLNTLDSKIYENIKCVGELVERSDCMIGRYSGQKKARFQKHVDNTQEDGRRLACVVYLNDPECWNVEEDGGDLKLHLPLWRSQTCHSQLLREFVMQD